MIWSNFIFAFRSFKRHIGLNALNTLGLSIGVAAFIVLNFYIYLERSYDVFHKDADIIYRVESNFLPFETKNDKLATASFGYGPAMEKEIPEIESYCRINLFQHEKELKYKDRVYREQFVTPVDSNFFTFFSFPLLEGNPQEVLSAPSSMVISESAAQKYFNGENPMGQMMEIKTINSSEKYTITGVFKDFPQTSHFKSDFLLSYPYASHWMNTTWYMHEAYLYIKVQDESNLSVIKEKFKAISQKYKNKKALKNKSWEIELIPLRSIHLNEPKAYELENKGSRKSLHFLSLIALLVIIIAWVNYINISTTYALERRGEIGIRKVNGAGAKHLFSQFITEALFANVLAVLLSIVLISIFLPFIESHIIEKDLSGIWYSAMLYWGVIVVMFVGVVLTGIAPALMLLKIKTVNIVINKSAIKGGHRKLREVLVITQFVIAIILIVGTLVVRKQIEYMSKQDLGVDISHTLVFKAPSQTSDYQQKMETLKDEIDRISGVKAIALSSSIPGEAVAHCLSNNRVDMYADRSMLCEMLRVDDGFVELYDLEILAGRSFIYKEENDKNSLVMTETAAKLFGFNDYNEAINRELKLEGINKKFKIIGILKDYHHLSLKDHFRPIVLFMAEEHQWIRNRFVSIKIFGSQYNTMLDNIEKEFVRVFPDASFDYFFLDQFFNSQYQNDKRFGSMFFLFTWIGILIVCLGIIGLSRFILIKRTKEIGVRKVNGATRVEIVLLLAFDIVKWMIIALIIATPIAFLLMHKWLDNFPQKTTLDWWIFAFAGFLALGISLLTVSWQSWRAATRNPVEALRYE